MLPKQEKQLKTAAFVRRCWHPRVVSRWADAGHSPRRGTGIAGAGGEAGLEHQVLSLLYPQ